MPKLVCRLSLTILALSWSIAIAQAQGPAAGADLFATQRLPPPEILPDPPAEELPMGTKTPLAEQTKKPPLDAAATWEFWTPSFWKTWEGNIELGMNGTDGNSETFNIQAGILAKRKAEYHSEQIQLTSIEKRANGATTANTALIDKRLDLPMPQSRFNAFVHSLDEYDQFKAFRWRVSGDAGLGYEFIQDDITTLIGRFGGSVSHEIGGPNDVYRPELYFGGEFKHKWSDAHQISATVNYYPNVNDFTSYRLNSQAAWQIALSQAYGISLKLSVIDRYDSQPLGKRPNDATYSTLLLWTF